MNNIYLCAICNIESGTCNEDCKFCTQSVQYKADIQRYKNKDITSIVQEAKQAYKNSAVGFCLVTAGKGLTDSRLKFVSQAAKAIQKEVPDLSLIACNGTASKEQLLELKNAGIENYNHNLETSKDYYPHICSTHSWEQRYKTCEDAKSIGLHLCTGGIFGMGESHAQRKSLIQAIASLEPVSIPLNFFHPNPSLPIQNNISSKKEAFDLIQATRQANPDAMIMIAGGREYMFGENQYSVFEHGANAVVIGDYLTTQGNSAQKDIQEIQKRGYTIATSCH